MCSKYWAATFNNGKPIDNFNYLFLNFKNFVRIWAHFSNNYDLTQQRIEIDMIYIPISRFWG